MATQKKSRKESSRRSEGSSWFDRLTPFQKDLLSVAFLYLVTLVLFRGIVFSDAAFSGEGDTASAFAYNAVGKHIMETDGVDPLWMPYFFSGMPTFGNVAFIPHNVSYLQVAVVGILKLIYLNVTMSWMLVHYLLGGIFTLILLRVWRFPHLAALLGALTFMLSPYAIGLAQEGHGSKLMALSYLPLAFLLTHLLLERRNLLSFGLFAAGIGTLLLTNHMQIVYYVLMFIGVYIAYEIAVEVRSHPMAVARKTALFGLGTIIGLGISSYIYLSVYEYAQFSIRGGGTEGSTGGLTWDYATNWSFHPFEMLNYLIPSFFGFSSNNPQMWQGQLTPLPLYWGTMPFTTSTVYVGIIPILLSIIALVYRRNRMTMFFALASVLIFLVSFGKHFAPLYDILFSYLPFFNKFRAPAMILQLIAFTTAVLGAYGMTVLLDIGNGALRANTEKLKKALLVTAGVLGSLLLLGLVFRSPLYDFLSGFMFSREGESYAPQVIAELRRLRFEVLWNDYVKFALLGGSAIGAVFFFLNKKISAVRFGAAMIVILLIDLFIMDAKFINPQPITATEESFKPDATVSYLLNQEKDRPERFRILPVPIFGDIYGDNSFAYHRIQSAGGYHPAKLKIYQTIMDSCMNSGWDPSFPLNMNIINMLNVKYLVAPGQLPPGMFEMVNADQARNRITYRNTQALPRAFFVDSVVIAQNDSEVFRILNSPEFNPGRTAILQQPLSSPVQSPGAWQADITEFKAHRIAIRCSTSAAALMVLGEIYYPAGWKAFVDGNETRIHRTNSILRSVVVPAGDHEVVFEFHSDTYETGKTLSHASWGVALLCVLAGLWQIPGIRNRISGKTPPEQRGGA